MGKDDKVYSEVEIKEKLKKDLPLWVFESNWIKRNGRCCKKSISDGKNQIKKKRIRLHKKRR